MAWMRPVKGGSASEPNKAQTRTSSESGISVIGSGTAVAESNSGNAKVVPPESFEMVGVGVAVLGSVVGDITVPLLTAGVDSGVPGVCCWQPTIPRLIAAIVMITSTICAR